MPISKDKAALYPRDWKAISRRVRDRDGNRCACTGECGRDHGERPCGARNGEPHPVTGSKVVLTCAHLDQDPTSDDESRMKALCQRCHLALDQEQHRASSADTRTRKADAASGQGRMFR